QAVADDAGVAHQALDVTGAEAGHLRRVEAGEGLAVALALAQDRQPGQAGLGAVEQELLVPAPVVVDGDAPLLVVVAGEELVARGPGAAGGQTRAARSM